MKKYKQGKKVKTLNALKKLQVVYVVPWQKAHPTSFFLSWQWRLIDGWVSRGLICQAVKVEQPKRKKKPC